MKTHAYANRLTKILLAIFLIMLMTIPTRILAANKASEEEAVLPIKVSYTDMVVDLKIQRVSYVQNGSKQTKNMTDQKMGKLEIYRKSVDSTDVDITYNVTVTNNGNSAGTVEKILVLLPKAGSSVSTDWKAESSTILTSTDFGTIEAGQSVSKEVTIKGNATELIGTNTVSAMIISNDDIDQRIIQKDQGINVTGINEENTIKDTNNYDQASMIISISTGLENLKIVILILLSLIVVAISIYLIKKYTKEKQLKK